MNTLSNIVWHVQNQLQPSQREIDMSYDPDLDTICLLLQKHKMESYCLLIS